MISLRADIINAVKCENSENLQWKIYHTPWNRRLFHSRYNLVSMPSCRYHIFIGGAGYPLEIVLRTVDCQGNIAQIARAGSGI